MRAEGGENPPEGESPSKEAGIPEAASFCFV
jgi:hypothetical protein